MAGARPLREAPDFPGEARPAADEAAKMAIYIADMTAELATLAGRAGFPMLAYFLNIARVEAQINARELGDRTPARDV